MGGAFDDVAPLRDGDRGGCDAPARALSVAVRDRRSGLTFHSSVGVSGPLATAVNAIVDDFNRFHPNVPVTPVFAGDCTRSLTKSQTAVIGDSPPDVPVLLSADLFTLLAMNATVPLDRFIQGAPST